MVYRYIVKCCRGGPLTSVSRRNQAVLVTALLDAIIRNTFIIRVYSATPSKKESSAKTAKNVPKQLLRPNRAKI